MHRPYVRGSFISASTATDEGVVGQNWLWNRLYCLLLYHIFSSLLIIYSTVLTKLHFIYDFFHFCKFGLIDVFLSVSKFAHYAFYGACIQEHIASTQQVVQYSENPFTASLLETGILHSFLRCHIKYMQYPA